VGSTYFVLKDKHSPIFSKKIIDKKLQSGGGVVFLIIKTIFSFKKPKTKTKKTKDPPFF
jgi:hypothetical protein